MNANSDFNIHVNANIDDEEVGAVVEEPTPSSKRLIFIVLGLLAVGGGFYKAYASRSSRKLTAGSSKSAGKKTVQSAGKAAPNDPNGTKAASRQSQMPAKGLVALVSSRKGALLGAVSVLVLLIGLAVYYGYSHDPKATISDGPKLISDDPKLIISSPINRTDVLPAEDEDSGIGIGWIIGGIGLAVVVLAGGYYHMSRNGKGKGSAEKGAQEPEDQIVADKNEPLVASDFSYLFLAFSEPFIHEIDGRLRLLDRAMNIYQVNAYLGLGSGNNFLCFEGDSKFDNIVVGNRNLVLMAVGDNVQELRQKIALSRAWLQAMSEFRRMKETVRQYQKLHYSQFYSRYEISNSAYSNTPTLRNSRLDTEFFVYMNEPISMIFEKQSGDQASISTLSADISAVRTQFLSEIIEGNGRTKHLNEELKDLTIENMITEQFVEDTRQIVFKHNGKNFSYTAPQNINILDLNIIKCEDLKRGEIFRFENEGRPLEKAITGTEYINCQKMESLNNDEFKRAILERYTQLAIAGVKREWARIQKELEKNDLVKKITGIEQIDAAALSSNSLIDVNLASMALKHPNLYFSSKYSESATVKAADLTTFDESTTQLSLSQSKELMILMNLVKRKLEIIARAL